MQRYGSSYKKKKEKKKYNELKYRGKKWLIMLVNTKKCLHIWTVKQRHRNIWHKKH